MAIPNKTPRNLIRHLFTGTITLLTLQLLAGNVLASDLAIEGYDPVAYFTLEKATKGNSQFSYKWNGHEWHFHSDKHRKLFIADPQKYAPQFNGFCANGLSDGHIVDGDPENWRVIDGKLYLFFSEYGRNQWGGNVKPLLQRARDTLNEH